MRVRIENEYTFPWGTMGYDSILEYEIFGSGTMDSPFSLKPTVVSESGYTIKIWNSKAFIDFTNQKIYGISLYNCSNISIQNSELRYLDIENCHHINLTNLNVKKTTKIIKSENIKIATLKSDALHINACLTTLLTNSSINKLYQTEHSDLIVKNTIVKKHKTV